MTAGWRSVQGCVPDVFVDSVFLHVGGWKWFPQVSSILNVAFESYWSYFPCWMKTYTPPSIHSSIYPSAATPDLSKVELITIIMFQLFLSSLAEGRREGKLRKGDILNHTLPLSRSSRLLGGPCYPFVTPLWCVNGCTEVDVLANSKIAEQNRMLQV